MQVTRYQMHNVLDCYSKKLSRTRGKDTIAKGSLRKSTDEMAFSSDTSRMAAMNKISRQVLDKVMDVVALSSAGKASRNSGHANDTGAEGVGEAAPVDFRPSGVDSIGRQHTARSAASSPGE